MKIVLICTHISQADHWRRKHFPFLSHHDFCVVYDKLGAQQLQGLRGVPYFMLDLPQDWDEILALIEAKICN
jgi:hypothetical protein